MFTSARRAVDAARSKNTIPNIRIDRIISIKKRHTMPPDRHARFSIIRDSLLF